jgi:hypothetical protein
VEVVSRWSPGCMVLEDACQYSVFREGSVQYVYNDWERFHPFLTFDISLKYLNNLRLHINYKRRLQYVHGEK